MPNGKHLTLEEREIVEKGIVNGADKTAIAKTLGKSKSTISLEIKKHREIRHSTLNIKLQCANYRICKFGRNCHKNCPDYAEFKCPRRDRSPGACNGCEKTKSCHFVKYYYSAIKTHHIESEIVPMISGLFCCSREGGSHGRLSGPLRFSRIGFNI